jgi:hypothetical protein
MAKNVKYNVQGLLLVSLVLLICLAIPSPVHGKLTIQRDYFTNCNLKAVHQP